MSISYLSVYSTWNRNLKKRGWPNRARTRFTLVKYVIIIIIIIINIITFLIKTHRHHCTKRQMEAENIHLSHKVKRVTSGLGREIYTRGSILTGSWLSLESDFLITFDMLSLLLLVLSEIWKIL